MALRDLIHVGERKRRLPVFRDDDSPFAAIERHMNRMFENFFRDWFAEPLRWPHYAETFEPRVNCWENDKEVCVTAELPGMDEKDVEVTVTKDSLILKGEKREEHEEKDRDYYRMERSYGSFRRVIPLPDDVDWEKGTATFKKGVLTVTLPKAPGAAKEQKKIEVKAE